MPTIFFECPKMNREQKAEIVREFTDVAARVTGIRREAFVVYLKENNPENIGVGGGLLADRTPEKK